MSQAATSTTDETWTVLRLLNWTRDWLAKQGCASARLDAELLLAHVLQCNRLQLLMRFDQPVERSELDAFKQLIKRRAKLEPVAYILGRKSFYDMDFLVTPAVLVPRPETESLVDAAIAFLQGPQAPAGDVLDLCTGSGCVAIALERALAKAGPSRAVTATDASEAALEVATRNGVALGAEISWRCGDLWQAVAADSRYACIVSNPPYVRSADVDRLDRDVRDYEPRLALDGGSDGSDVLRRIVQRAVTFLVPGGLLAVELGSRAQAEALNGPAQQHGLLDIKATPVLGGPTQVWTARAPAV
jgi:release factor glutamine methyltransferase